jgi:hypothetical protein
MPIGGRAGCRCGRPYPLTGSVAVRVGARTLLEGAYGQQQADHQRRQRDQNEGKVERHSNSLIGRRAALVEPPYT